MTGKEKNPTQAHQRRFLLVTSAILILSMLAGCGPSTKGLEAVDHTPVMVEYSIRSRILTIWPIVWKNSGFRLSTET